jgi:hypothetical protein
VSDLMRLGGVVYLIEEWQVQLIRQIMAQAATFEHDRGIARLTGRWSHGRVSGQLQNRNRRGSEGRSDASNDSNFRSEFFQHIGSTSSKVLYRAA